ncbi:MAG: ABC transporter substrate-binding protein [Desulfobacterales bacterium]|nr:ABC transporter substrate-binding protein [Desulfobacterales bacterium]
MNVPYFQLKDLFARGGLSRREFLWSVALLGMFSVPVSKRAGFPWPAEAFGADRKRGGIIKVATLVRKITHPARVSREESANILRQVAEGLTLTDESGLTHPYLLDGWQAGKDLKTWDLNLRQGIRFNNGDLLTADDVIFSMHQWLNKDTGSCLPGLMGSYLDRGGIEKTGPHGIRLHLTRAEIALPEHLSHDGAMILNHKTFEGDFCKAPHGTGPFTLGSYRENDRALLTRRNDYWQKGADGKSLPYLDGAEFIDTADEMSLQIAALLAGRVDMIDPAAPGGTAAFNTLGNDPRVKIKPMGIAQARVLRMQVDLKPWNDNRVRMALKLCQNRQKILHLAYFDQGIAGHDGRLCPRHPEYCPQPAAGYDPQKARHLLQEAGYFTGLNVNLAVAADWADAVRYAEILRQDARPAGFNIRIHAMPIRTYREKRRDFDLAITPWTLQPAGALWLDVTHVAHGEGKPAPWNETNWADKEFIKLLEQAGRTPDSEERRKIFHQLQRIQQERGAVAIACWQNTWQITSRNVQDARPHPSGHLRLDKVWLRSPHSAA